MKLSVNVVGVTPIAKIVEIGKIAEKSGFHGVWVGDGPQHRHVFPIITSIAKNTNHIRIGTSILSIHAHNPIHVFKGFELLSKVYGSRFALGIGRGGAAHLSHIGKDKNKTFPLLNKYAEMKTGKPNLPIYIGATGFKTIKLYHKKFDGIIFNFISERLLRVYLKVLNVKPKNTLVIGPAYYEPNKKERAVLLRNCALIASEIPEEISDILGIKMEIMEIQKHYRRGDLKKLKSFEGFLIENFSISGSKESFTQRLTRLNKIGISEVILGYPVGENIHKFISLTKELKDILNE